MPHPAALSLISSASRSSSMASSMSRFFLASRSSCEIAPLVARRMTAASPANPVRLPSKQLELLT